MNLVGSWNQLLRLIPADLLLIATIIGVGILVFFIVKFFVDKRRQGVATFPWGWTIAGGILAAPSLLVPAVLSVLQLVLTIIFDIFRAIGNL